MIQVQGGLLKVIKRPVSGGQSNRLRGVRQAGSLPVRPPQTFFCWAGQDEDVRPCGGTHSQIRSYTQ